MRHLELLKWNLDRLVWEDITSVDVKDGFVWVYEPLRTTLIPVGHVDKITLTEGE